MITDNSFLTTLSLGKISVQYFNNWNPQKPPLRSRRSSLRAAVSFFYQRADICHDMEDLILTHTRLKRLHGARRPAKNDLEQSGVGGDPRIDMLFA